MRGHSFHLVRCIDIEMMAGVLERALGTKPKELVAVDMGAKLLEARLAAHFPAESWPPTLAVRFVALCVA